MVKESTELWTELNQWVENGVARNIYTALLEKENCIDYLHLLILENKIDTEKCDIYGKKVGDSTELVLVENKSIHIINYSGNNNKLTHQEYRGEVVYKEVKINKPAPTEYNEIKIGIANKELSFTNDETFKNFEKFVESL